MKLLRRILVTIVVTLAVVFLCLYRVVPIALSFYAARKAPAVAKVLPADLKDASLSPSPTAKLSYLGYDFEVPWTDLDDSKTKLYPQNKPEKTMALLTFRSGLRLMVLAGQPRSFAHEFVKDMKVSPQAFEAIFGHDAAVSDYAFTKRVYAFTPDSMHHWTLSTPLFAREEMLLMVKSVMPSKPAQTGIFNIRNQDFQGFQQGNPHIRQDYLVMTLFSGSGSFEITFLQKDYASPLGVTQPEINRIIQSVRKTSPGEVAQAGNQNN